MIRLPSNRTRATTLLRWQFACPCFVASYREPFIELVSNRFESLNRRRRGTDPSGTNCSNLDRDRVMDAFEARFFLLFLSRFSPNSRSTRKSVVYIYSVDLLLFSTEVSAESIQLLPFIANFLSNPRATKLVFPKTSNSFLNRAPRLIYALIKRGRWFPRASSRR